MDNFFKKSVRNSTVDSLVDKFKFEITKKSEEDFINTRKLTIPSTVTNAANAGENSHDIDRQISDLETLIKRLQDEIVEMSSSSQPTEEFHTMKLDEISHMITNIENEDNLDVKDTDEVPIEELPNIIEADSIIDSDTATKNIYPMPVINDELLLIEENSKKFGEVVTDLLNVTDKEDSTQEFTSIRRNFSQLWEQCNSTESNDDAASLQTLIDELKSEISEKMESLKDVDIGQPLNNSKEDIPN